jgi:hypothetical protein
MNSIFSRDRRVRRANRSVIAILVISFGLVLIVFTPFATWLPAQSGGDPTAEFKRISEELSAARLGGGDENEAQMEKALAYLDSFAVSALNISAEPNLDEANRDWPDSQLTRLPWGRITAW